MLERRKEYAKISAFDVNVEKESKELAEETGVKIFTADIIHHLFDKFTTYMAKVNKMRRFHINVLRNFGARIWQLGTDYHGLLDYLCT